MNGAGTAIGAAGSIYPPVKQNHPDLSEGARHAEKGRTVSDASGTLTSAENALSRSLGSAGFVDLNASFKESFVRGLHYHHAEAGVEDLKPGVLDELMSWMTSKIAADSSQALAAQARVSAEAAIHGLT